MEFAEGQKKEGLEGEPGSTKEKVSLGWCD